MTHTTVYDIRQSFLREWMRMGRPTAQDGKMIELMGVSFRASEPTIFKSPNLEYIDREIEWYLSQSLNVHDFPGGAPRIWREVANHDGEINSNYGNLVFSTDNFRQYHHVLQELRDHPESRRAVMIYTRPLMHLHAVQHGKNDFVCTNAVQYLIRDDRLHAIVQMRSNDAVFGYRNDFAWQYYILRQLLVDLEDDYPDLHADSITWQVGSLHIYPRHVHLIQRYYETGNPE